VIHFAWLRFNRGTAFCGAGQTVLVTWNWNLVECQKCWTHRYGVSPDS